MDMIELYSPTLDELGFRQMLIADEATMSYNHAYGGTISFPREVWADWYRRWLGQDSQGKFYRYLRVDGSFVGEVAYHLDKERNIYLVSIIILASKRDNGYGKAALSLLCQEAKKAGIDALYDDIAFDNPAIALFDKAGFEIVGRNDETILLKKNLNP